MAMSKQKRLKKVVKEEKALFGELQALVTKMKSSLDKHEAEMGKPLPCEIVSIDSAVIRLQDTLCQSERECDSRGIEE